MPQKIHIAKNSSQRKKTEFNTELSSENNMQHPHNKTVMSHHLILCIPVVWSVKHLIAFLNSMKYKELSFYFIFY